jgi:hypothetical protein
VVFGRTGGLGGRDTDAVVAIAKLVLPRLPGG